MKLIGSIPFKLFLCCLAVGLIAFVPRDGDPLGKLMTGLQRWTDSIPQEKVYLQMDKPYYAIGDTIWFKGYVTVGPRHQLSALSGAVYVELINENDSLMQRLKLPVTSGMVLGNFILDDDYVQGSYRVRAYTQWMRNAGEDYFYDHTVLVGDGGGNVISKVNFNFNDAKGKPELTAMLNYTNEQGSALGEKELRYEIRRQKKVFWQQNAKTDALGNLRINIPDDVRKNATGVYIHTTVKVDDKYTYTRDFPIKASLTQSDFQFFPESGSLVTGVNSRVAFKAVGIDGLGLHVKGTVADNDGNEVARFETLHAGMGSFSMNPQPGKTYTATLAFDDGNTKTVKLPAAADKGYVLAIYQPNKDSVLVRIHAAANSLQTHINLIAHMNGEAIFSSPIDIVTPLTSVWLDKKDLPSGVAQFTLFNSNGEPLNERVAFLRTNDQMKLDIKSTKINYKSKDQVTVELNAKDSKGKPTFGNFSVSVVDESKVPVDDNKESTILSNLLLTSDLKGYVEQPNYYFAEQSDEVNKALDNLMLTQGYRRFVWKELDKTINSKPVFPVEGLGTTLSGKVTTLGHKPVANASVILVALRAGVNKNTTTDAAGHFKFDGIFMTDSIKFSIQALKGKSDKVIVEMDTIPRIRITPNRNLPDVSTDLNGSLKAYMAVVQKEDDIYEKNGLLDKVHRLREVRIKSRKPKPSPYKTPYGLTIPEGHADQTYEWPAGKQCATLGVCMAGMLSGVFFQPKEDIISYPFCYYSKGGGRPILTPMQVLLDGRKLQTSEIADLMDGSYIEPDGIGKIDVVRTNIGLISFLGGPTLLIYTKRDYVRRPYNPSVVEISPKGFNKVRDFYSPRYTYADNSNLPDLRTTIYWNPYLKTDADGKTTFSFYNAEGPGTYRVTIEGINADGQLGRQVFKYVVGGGMQGLNMNVPPAKKDTPPIAALVDSMNKRLPIEKAYLQTDKPYYFIGDTLWFKSYVLNGANLTPSRRSGILYVELDDDSTNITRRISIPLTNGIGSGQIPLKPVVFKEGGYTLRAYTNWMQNFNGDYMFTQHFYLGIPSTKSWLVKAASKLQNVDGKDLIEANLKLAHADDALRPVAYQKVLVKVYDEWHYLSKQEMQTGADGNLDIKQDIGPKSDGRRIRVQITSLNKDDGYLVTEVPLQINRNQNIDVQFLPEGGHLVAGLKSVVGFKALAEDGHGIAVVGGIYDSKNNKVVSFIPLHNGMGSFEFIPQPGETYKAQISEPIAKAYLLPKIEKEGTVMHIDNPEKGNELRVEVAGMRSLQANGDCYLIGMSRGVIYYSQKVNLSDSVLTVPKSQFPSGVAKFTFFKDKAPLNERAVFIDNNDALSIAVKTNKESYAKRDSVSLDIEVRDKAGMPVQGDFALAVTDDSQVKPDSLDNHGIAASLLLNAELRGDIESPGYYLSRKDKIAWQALNNLMLTQGWTGYDWKDIFAPAKPVKYQPEQPYIIKGKAVNVIGKPKANTIIRVTAIKPLLSGETTTDEKGNFEFKNLPKIDTGAYLLQVVNRQGKVKSFGEVMVDRFKAEIPPQVAKVLAMPWYVNTDTVELNFIKRKAAMSGDDIALTGRVLQEVKINSTKIIPNSHNVFGPGGSDLVYNKKDIKATGAVNLYELLQQKLPGLKVLGYRATTIKGENQTIPILAFNGYSVDLRIDGYPVALNIDIADIGPEIRGGSINEIWAMNLEGPSISNKADKGRAGLTYSPFAADAIDALSQIQIDGVTGLEVVYTAKNTNRAGHVDFNWAHVEVTTQGGKGWYRELPVNTTRYNPIPLSEPKLFYSPKYHAESPVKVPDYRSTVFWEPYVTTDRNGKAHVSFYTTDVQSQYTVKMAGIANYGGLGDASIKLIPKNSTKAVGALKITKFDLTYKPSVSL